MANDASFPRLRAWLLAPLVAGALCGPGIAHPMDGAAGQQATLQFASQSSLQGDPQAEPERPQALILIAAPHLPDPNFERSVVLVTQTPVGEVIGVILNRPTDVPWPDGVRPPVQAREQRIHFGGPLIPNATFGIGAAASPVGAGVAASTLDLGAGLRFAVGLKNVLSLAAASASAATPGELKLFRGYAGWGPGQLEAEIDAGVWEVREVSADLVFDPAPATQWERLTALRRAVRVVPDAGRAVRVVPDAGRAVRVVPDAGAVHLVSGRCTELLASDPCISCIAGRACAFDPVRRLTSSAWP